MKTTLLNRPGAHLLQTVPNLSQDGVMFSGGAFVHAEVLGEIGGIYTKLDPEPDATEANEAVAVSFSRVDATENDMPGLAHCRLTAVRAEYLVWPERATDEQKAAWIKQLEARHIIAR